MQLYASVCYELAEQLTKRYSTSFSLSSRLFDRSIRQHIYAIYGLVRIADEIVDAYRGSDASVQVDQLHDETMRAINSGYSVNPIVHAFALTAKKYGIDDELIAPFFDSMAMDLEPNIAYDAERYERYIYGSAEVVGLMCLKVFVEGNNEAYHSLSDGARSLGAAYQKVNFLRDIRNDHEELGRNYFPDAEYETFNESDKDTIVHDIKRDFAAANDSIGQLPQNAKRAVRASYYYYHSMLLRLERSSVDEITSRRIRISTIHKVWLLCRARVGL